MLMKLLQSYLPRLTPENTKVHLARHDNSSYPLSLFFKGEFDQWQSKQTRRIFECEYLIGFVELPGTKNWLFTGVYDSLEVRKVVPIRHGSEFEYGYRRVAELAELEGRLVVQYKKSGASCIFFKTCASTMILSSVLEQPMTVQKFPGYKDVDVSNDELKIIVSQGLESWQSALSSVAGVYLISDRTEGEHQLYVGSATGTGGLWDRWSNYANSGHGGNTRIRDLHTKRGKDFAENFRFSILEIADKHTGKDEMS